MIASISILLPAYNTPCVELVKALHKQAICIPNLSFEIIVLDDGSTDLTIIETNKEIDNLSHCRYLLRGYNRGRAATRNELASYARFDWLLFIDSDMVVRCDNYLRNYIKLEDVSVVYGGYTLKGDKEKLKGNLRYKYECVHGGNSDANERNQHPYNDFHTSNYLVKRNIMTRYPLDERFVRYGYEDVMWGKTMSSVGIQILHVDNPLSFEIFEENKDFVEKTTVGMATLAQFATDLEGYSRILAAAGLLRRWHMVKPFSMVFALFKEIVKSNLLGNNPSIFQFNIYKIGMYLKFSEK